MEFELGKNSIRLWHIRGALVALPACFVCGIVAALFSIVGTVLCIIFIVVYLLYYFWYVPCLLRFSSAGLGNGRPTRRAGVLSPIRISLRLKTILIASTSHTSPQGLLGLCALLVRSVGVPISPRQLAEPNARELLRRIEEAADD